MSRRPIRAARRRWRGEEGSALTLALVMVVAFGLVAVAAARYAVVNMADTVVTRDRTAALEAAAGGARLAISQVGAAPATSCQAPGPAGAPLAVPQLNDLDVAVTCATAEAAHGRTITVTSQAGGRTIVATARIGLGTPAPVAITSWVTDAP